MFKRPAFIGLLAACAVFAWMFLTVQFMFEGNWTSLYMIGPRTPFPASIAPERLYIFPNNSGYDGQSFHLTAHDPWMRRYKPADVQTGEFRYARILVPALAWILALGQDRWIDPAYFTVIVASVFLGAYWTARYAARVAVHPAWGLLFVLSPATLTSIDRALVDVTLAALCAAFVLYTSQDSLWRSVLVLTAALLTRETAWILLLAYGLWLLGRHRFADFCRAACAAIPLLAWQIYIAARTGARAATPPVHGWIPLAGFVDRLLHPFPYQLPRLEAAVTTAFDYVALAGIALAVVLALRQFCSAIGSRSFPSPTLLAMCGFAASLIFHRSQPEWDDPWSFARIYAPLPLMLSMTYFPSRLWIGLAPTLLIDSRIALNYARHAQQIVEGAWRMLESWSR